MRARKRESMMRWGRKKRCGCAAGAALLAIPLQTLVFASCGQSGSKAERRRDEIASSSQAVAMQRDAKQNEDMARAQSYAPHTESSVYDLSVVLTTQRGVAVGLDAWRGYPTIVAMFYATCPAACPRLIEDIKRVLAALPAESVRKVRVLLVSFDAARDTPGVLDELARKHQLDDNWIVASAADAYARELAAVLDVKFRPIANGEFFHTSVITAVRGDGVAVLRAEALQDPAAFAAAWVSLQNPSAFSTP